MINYPVMINQAKNYFPVLAFIILIVIGGFVFIKQNRSDNSPPAKSVQKPTTVSSGPFSSRLLVGSPDAKVTVVEYFDYKCPSCNNFHRTTHNELVNEFINEEIANIEVRIIPILGPDSARAGYGAYCSNEQGEFLTYHDSVLEFMWQNYYSSGDYSSEFDDILSLEKIKEIVASTNIDNNELEECINSEKYADILNENLELAREDEIQGTPGFAIGEQTFAGGQPITVFRALIKLQINEQIR